MAIWNQYHSIFYALELNGALRRPVLPKNCQHNAHMYYAILPSRVDREKTINRLKAKNINAVSHYVPLHSSPAGLIYCRSSAELNVTKDLSERLIRFPMWIGLTHESQFEILSTLNN